MIGGILLSFIIFLFNPTCLFKRLFNISCPACGMTRAFFYLLNGDVISAFEMNILSIPLFLLILIYIFLYILKLIFKKDYIYRYYDYFIKHYKFLLVILLINWIYNIFKYTLHIL